MIMIMGSSLRLGGILVLVILAVLELACAGMELEKYLWRAQEYKCTVRSLVRVVYLKQYLNSMRDSYGGGWANFCSSILGQGRVSDSTFCTALASHILGHVWNVFIPENSRSVNLCCLWC